jgi:hypothetical protein
MWATPSDADGNPAAAVRRRPARRDRGDAGDPQGDHGVLPPHASLAEQTFAGREMALTQGDGLACSFTVLTSALGRHRDKGRLHRWYGSSASRSRPGGQAIVGAVNQDGGGGPQRKRGMIPGKAAAPAAACPCTGACAAGADAGREPVPIAGGKREAAPPDARWRPRQRHAAR